MKKLVASGLCGILILLSPGIPCYQALAAGLGSGHSESGGNAGKESPKVAPKIGGVSLPLSFLSDPGMNLAGKFGTVGVSGSASAPIPEGGARIPISNGGIAVHPEKALDDSRKIQGHPLASARTAIAGLQNSDAADILSKPESKDSGIVSRILGWIFDKDGKKGEVSEGDSAAVAGKTRSGQARLDPPSARVRTGDPEIPSPVLRGDLDGLKGKTLLLIGSKKTRDYLLEEPLAQAGKYGFEVVLIDHPDQKDYAVKLGLKPENFIAADIGNHSAQNIAEVVSRIRELGKTRPIHAVKTFLNAYAILEAELAQGLGLPGNSPESVRAAHAKDKARELMNRDPDLYLPFQVVKSPKEAAAAFKAMKAEGADRVVLKPASGGGGLYVVVDVDSPQKAAGTFSDIEGKIERLAAGDARRAGAKNMDQKPAILMEAQIPDGIMLDVEMLLENGEAAWIGLSYNPPAHQGNQEKGTTYPSLLTPGQVREVERIARKAVRALGLGTGNVHLEAILTAEGVKVVEVNARMGGGDVWENILESSGVNLIEQGIFAAFKVPMALKPKAVPTLLQHRFILPKASGRILSIEGWEELAREEYVYHAELHKAAGDGVLAVPEESSDFIGYVTIRGREEGPSLDRLLELLAKVKIRIQKADGTIVEQTAAYAHDRVLVRDLLPRVTGPKRSAKPSWLERLKGRLDFSKFNSSERAFILGQAIFILAISIYLACLPLLVHAITGNAAMTGVVRAVHWWVLGAASLFTGSIVKRSPMMWILRPGTRIRGLIFGAMGALTLLGLLPWPALLVLVAFNALTVSFTHLLDIDTGGSQRVFDSDRKIASANFLYDALYYSMLLVVPPLMGIPLDWLSAKFGPGAGAGAGFVFFGALMGLAASVYGKVKPIKDVAAASLKQLFTGVKGKLSGFFKPGHRKAGLLLLALGAAGVLAAPMLGVGMNVVAGLVAAGGLGLLFKEDIAWLFSEKYGKLGIFLTTLGAAALIQIPLFGNPAAIAGLALLAAAALVLFHWETLKVISRDRRILAPFALSTMVNFLDDAFSAVVLTTLAIDVLAAGAFGSGFLWSGFTLGGLLASKFLLSRSQKIEDRIGTYGLLALLTAMAGLAFIPSIALWASLPAFIMGPLSSLSSLLIGLTHLPLTPPLLAAFAAAAAVKFLYQPLRTRMRVLTQTSVKNDPQAGAQAEEIFALGTFFEVLAAGAGALTFSWLFRHAALLPALGSNPPMAVVTIALAAIALVAFAGLLWIKPSLARPGYRVHKGAGEEALALKKLEANLEKMGLASYRKVTVEKPADPLRPTVAMLAPASVYKLSIAREGGRQSPGDVHLVLDTSWLIQEIRPDGRNRLLLTKGLYFDEAGSAVLAEYKEPRPVRYFADFYTLSGNDREDGVPLEKNLDVPMSSSVQLEKVTNDKALTRLLLAARGIAVPATLALLMAGHPLNARAEPEVLGVSVAQMPGSRDEIKRKIEDFLKTYDGAELVIKPSGPQYHSARGVKLFPRDQLEAMADHVMALSHDQYMPQDGAVLVDGRLTPPPLYLRTGDYGGGGAFGFMGKKISLQVLNLHELRKAGPKERKDWNFRVLAARAPWNGGATTGIFARAGAWGVPTNAEPADPEDAAAFVKFEEVIRALREQHGLLKTDAEAAAFRAELEALGRKALEALAESEKKRERKEGEPYQAQTDYIGLDVMVEFVDGRLVPKVIEVNDHDAGGQWQMDLFYPERAGEHSREWVATMLERARLDALRGKRIVIVGAGYEGKRPIFERARELGVKIVLIDKGSAGLKRLAANILALFGVKIKDHWARDLVSEFIAVDTSRRGEALAKAWKKLLRSVRKNGRLDGIATFWEDDVPLTAELARLLGLPYHSVAGADAARNKFTSRSLMAEKGLPTPRFEILGSAGELEAAMDRVGFPAVIKPVYGASAAYVVRVNDKEEARAAYAKIKKEISPELESSLSFGTQLMIEQYLSGREFDADIAMQKGRARVVTVTYNRPTREPHFIATGSSLPAWEFTPEETRRIEEAAVRAAREMGLTDGVIHIEGIYTEEGPVVITDPNGRMGGVYVRDWVKAVWGVDLVDQQLLIAAGIPISPFKSPEPLTHLEGEFVIGEKPGVLRTQALAPGAERHPGLHQLRQLKKPGERVEPPYDARTAMLVARGSTSEEARRNLEELRALLSVEIRPENPAKP